MTAGAEPIENKPSPPLAGTNDSQTESRPPWRRIISLAVIVGILLAIVYLSPLRDYLGRLREVSDSIKRLGLLAPLAVTLGIAVLVAMGFPRLLFCVISGMALGFWSGLLWAQLGTLLGNYGVFLLARFGGREWVQRYLSKRGRLHNLIQREGVCGVILARQLPMPGLIINLACGLFSIRHRDFLIGTAVGQLPEAIPCTLIGAGALEASFGKSAAVIGLAIAAAVAAWIGARSFVRWQRSRNCPTPNG